MEDRYISPKSSLAVNDAVSILNPPIVPLDALIVPVISALVATNEPSLATLNGALDGRVAPDEQGNITAHEPGNNSIHGNVRLGVVHHELHTLQEVDDGVLSEQQGRIYRHHVVELRQYADEAPAAGLLEADDVCVWLHWNFSCLLFA